MKWFQSNYHNVLAVVLCISILALTAFAIASWFKYRPIERVCPVVTKSVMPTINQMPKSKKVWI